MEESATVAASSSLNYLTGFGNTFESEVLAGALPRGRNNPRCVPMNLYTEQLSGTSFTTPRAENARVWLYRIQPSVAMMDLTPEEFEAGAVHEKEDNASSPYCNLRWFGGVDPESCVPMINPCRWKPLEPLSNSSSQEVKVDFVMGLKLWCAATDLRIYLYQYNQSMNQSSLMNAEGDFLIVPQSGTIHVRTELGRLNVAPGEITVIPRGIVFQVMLFENTECCYYSGYILEIGKGHFKLPELGPIGSNGLANARDFEYPVAWCIGHPIEYRQSHQIICKSGGGRLWIRESDHSPYNVVAWHGNYLPYKYSLSRFCAVNSVTYDHIDPSIYTVLTCPSDEHAAGTALADFVVFPSPRVMATDANTFRPPWFHRNIMSEFMGLIYGTYDAKAGFVPGGSSLHNCMTPHGPDAMTYQKATQDACATPGVFDGGLAFMFETCMPLKVSALALDDQVRDLEYNSCWHGLTDNFTGWSKLVEERNKKNACCDKGFG